MGRLRRSERTESRFSIGDPFEWSYDVSLPHRGGPGGVGDMKEDTVVVRVSSP